MFKVVNLAGFLGALALMVLGESEWSYFLLASVVLYNTYSLGRVIYEESN